MPDLTVDESAHRRILAKNNMTNVPGESAIDAASEPKLERYSANKREENGTPSFAPGLEQDNLKEEASEDEIERGDFTPVTSLILDRTGDD